MRVSSAVLVFLIPLAASAAAPDWAPPAPSRAELEHLARRVAAEEGADPRLVAAVIEVESGWNPRAVSRRGARGLMQLMPETARRLGVRDPFDPLQNLRGGIRELNRLIERYGGDLERALAAYNAGEGAVARHGGIPPYDETVGYVEAILSRYFGRPYRTARSGPRRRPVRMVRDPATGRIVLSNVPAAAGSSTRAPVLAGGFGR